MTVAPTIATQVITGYPPRVGLTVTASDADTVTVYQTTVAGRVVVPGAKDVSLAGATYVVDDSAPFGSPVQWDAVAKKAGDATVQGPTTAAVTLGQASFTGVAHRGAWLSNPARLLSSIPVVVNDWDERSSEANGEWYQPIGETRGTFVRFARADWGYTMTVEARTSAQRQAVRDLIEEANPILVRLGPSLHDPSTQLTDDYGAFAVGRVTERRTGLSYFTFELPLQPVRMPQLALTAEPGQDWATLESLYPSWDALNAAKANWIDVEKNVNP